MGRTNRYWIEQTCPQEAADSFNTVIYLFDECFIAIFCNYGYSPPYYLLTDTASQPGRLNLRLLMAGVEALNMVIADQDSEPDLNKQWWPEFQE